MVPVSSIIMAYDTIIIGAGPAGMSAAIYAIRYKLNHLVLSEAIGGTANEAHLVENYPGFYGISGMELMMKFKEHVDHLGGAITMERVTGIEEKDGLYVVTTPSESYETKTIVIAGGSKRRKLNAKGEDTFQGKGVSYCATCDAFFFKEKTVAVVGGNDSAASAAILLAQHAKKVYIIYRGEKVRAEPYWLDKIEENDKIEVINNTNVTEIKGTNVVESVALDSGSDLPVDGVFIEIGTVPPTDMAKAIGVETDERGYIKVDVSQHTNKEGVYAAGDITTSSNSCRQIVTAAAEGTVAVMSIFKHLNTKK